MTAVLRKHKGNVWQQLNLFFWWLSEKTEILVNKFWLKAAKKVNSMAS